MKRVGVADVTTAFGGFAQVADQNGRLRLPGFLDGRIKRFLSPVTGSVRRPKKTARWALNPDNPHPSE